MLILSDRIVASILDPISSRGQVVRALRERAEMRAGLSQPPSLFLRSAGAEWLYHVKGAYLVDGAIAGIRLGGFPQKNTTSRRLDMIVLTELESTSPLAIVATNTLMEFRVGAALAVAVEWLRSSSASILALVGTGRLARSVLRAIQATTPFPSIRVISRSPDSAKRFSHEMAAEGLEGLIAANSLEEACSGADVILTLTEADKPLIRAAWCGAGSLLVTAGGRQECEDRAILDADKIYVDDWEQCTMLGDIAVLHRQGKIREADVTGTLADVVAGKLVGRHSDLDRIVAVPQGLTILDVALSHFVYQRVKEQGIGQSVEW